MYLVLVIVQIAEGYAYLMMAPCMATVRRVTGPGTSTTPVQSMSAFHRPSRHCLHQARSAATYSAIA